MENKKFLTSGGLTVLTVILAVPTIYLTEYLIGGLLVSASLGFFYLSKQKYGPATRTKPVKGMMSFIEPLTEIGVLAPILVAPMVPIELAISALFLYSFQEIYRLRLERRLQKDLYPLFSPTWRILLLAGVLLVAFKQDYILYWTAWAFAGLYLLEILQVFRQLYQA